MEFQDSLFDSPLPKTSTEDSESPFADYQVSNVRRLVLKPKTEGDSPPFSSLNILDVLNGEIKDSPISEAISKPNPIRLDFDATEHNNDSHADVSVETQTVNILHSTGKELGNNYVGLKFQF